MVKKLLRTMLVIVLCVSGVHQLRASDAGDSDLFEVQQEACRRDGRLRVYAQSRYDLDERLSAKTYGFLVNKDRRRAALVECADAISAGLKSLHAAFGSPGAIIDLVMQVLTNCVVTTDVRDVVVKHHYWGRIEGKLTNVAIDGFFQEKMSSSPIHRRVERIYVCSVRYAIYDELAVAAKPSMCTIS